ncbi:MAG: LicD family protein [Clostridia bacterium]|nr:LicD family protein [Clostridia bacterium]
MQLEGISQEQHQKHQAALLRLLREFDRVCKQLNIPYVLYAGTLLGAVRHEGFIPWDDDLDVLMLREDYNRLLAEAPAVLDTDTFYLQKEFSDHWPLFFSKLRLNGTTCLEKVHPKDSQIHQGIYIDIFPCDNARRTEVGRRLQFAASKVVIAKALDKRGYDTDSVIKKLMMALCRLLPQKPFLRAVQRGRGDGDTVHTFLAGARKYRKNVIPRRFLTQRCEVTFAGDSYPAPADYATCLQMLYGNYMQLPPPEERVCKQHSILIDTEHSYEEYADYRNGMTFEVYTRSIR